MAILGDDTKRIERRRRAQDRADIVRIGHLIEHQQRPPIVRALLQQIDQEDILQRIDLDDDALVRRVLRHQPPQIGRLGEGHRHLRREGPERLRRLARRPDAADRPLGVGEGGGDGVPSPETGPVGRGLGRAMAFAHGGPLELFSSAEQRGPVPNGAAGRLKKRMVAG